MKIERLARGGLAILRPNGPLIGDQKTDELRLALERLSHEGNSHAIIDLSQVRYLNSAGIGVLVAAYNDYQRRHGKLKLSGLSEKTENVFVITKLTQVFEIYPNEKEALASFAAN